MVCTLGKCVKNNSTTQSFSIGKTIDVKEEYTPRIITEVSVLCKSDDDCRDVANSLCDISNGTCGCNAETHYLYQGNCVAGIKECTTSNDCTGSNMMCFKNTSCICKQGFFLKDKQCIAELGVKDSNVSYTEDGDCPIKPGKLVNSTCYCRDYWFSDDAARNCIKTMIQTTQTCLTNEWCYAMGPYAFCNSTTGQCACAEYASFNQSTYYCDKVEEPSSDICFSDNDCNLNEVCLDEKCGCLDNFKKNKDNICLPNVDASCLNTGCSHIGNSSCVGGICKCNDNYIGKEDGCLRMAEELYDACERQEQCARIEHTVCGVAEDDDDEEEEADEGDPVYKCVCGESYTAISKKCYLSKKYGDPCVTESDCTLVLNHSYQCRNSICQCSVGSKLKKWLLYLVWE
ncbi:hypothetical protein NQ317_014858 [Molorchus minor]|uniref:EGF-like domain-containing protein n=1 Tax=Molorchus minor TaxID=1323400 RepID=A0ABQ9J4L4_9CUCU|nr:hypothetical protein NQ317_014858 [Molorchus minor]